MEKLALAHPEITFHVLKDGQPMFRTNGDGSLYSAIYGVLGKLVAKDMIPVESRWDKYALSGFVSKATASRGNRSIQIFFVNGRLVRSKSMTVALEEAYRNRIMVGRFPFCVLHLRMPEHLVDVNVHPAKVEVKFLNERDVFDTIRYGVEGALDKTTDRPELKLPKDPHSQPLPQDNGGTLRKESATSLPVRSPKGDFYRTMTAEEYRNFAKVVSATPSVAPSPTVKEQLSQTPTATIPTEIRREEPVRKPEPPLIRREEPVILQKELVFPKAEAPAPVVSAPTAQTEPIPTEDVLTPEEPLLPTQELTYRLVGEVLNTYIIVEQDKTILFIDKHAAHERILFEKLKARQEPIMSQLLLTPILMNPEREEGTILLEQAELLSELGFSISDYGDGTLAVSEIPEQIHSRDAEATLNDIASQLLAGKRPDPTAVRDEILHTIACKAAIKGGQLNGTMELDAIVKEVLSREDLKYCPHGRPICITMTASQLERQFKR